MEVRDEETGQWLVTKARQLALLMKFFPASDGIAVGTLAGLLAEYCHDREQVESLVKEMRSRFDEWPGPATLKRIYDELYPPDREWKHNWGPADPVVCHKCYDIGVIIHVDTVLACECHSGDEEKAAAMRKRRAETNQNLQQNRKRITKPLETLQNLYKKLEEA